MESVPAPKGITVDETGQAISTLQSGDSFTLSDGVYIVINTSGVTTFTPEPNTVYAVQLLTGNLVGKPSTEVVVKHKYKAVPE